MTDPTSELYFEVAAYTIVFAEDELARSQQSFLHESSSDGSVTAAAIGGVGKSTGLTFDFAGTLKGRWKARRFLFLSNETRTFRIVHDPTSALNVRSLNRLVIKGVGRT